MMNNENIIENGDKPTIGIGRDKLTIELSKLLDYIENTLSKELPTPVIDLNYFIFAALHNRENLLNVFLDSNMTSMAIDYIHDAFMKDLKNNSLSVIKPNRKIIYDDEFKKIAMDAYTATLLINSRQDSAVSTIDMFLSILKSEDDTPKAARIKKLFNKYGMTYSIVKQKYDSGDYHKNESILDEIYGVELVDKSIVEIKDASSLPQNLQDGMPNKVIIKNISDLANMAEMPKVQRSSKTQNIRAFCSNVNDLVEQGKITELIGRERETNEIFRVLGRKKKNNVILLGGEGVGKTAIAENIAYRIVNGNVPLFMKDKVVISLDMTALIAGTSLRGMFESRVKGVLEEIRASRGKYILMIDNIGATMSDKTKNDYDISAMLSRSLSEGECQVIGTCDNSSYRKTIEKDPSFARRFQKIIIDAPSPSESLSIIRGVAPSYEEFHGVKFCDGVVDKCVELAQKYIPERNLPDSAIDILDEVGSFIGTVVDDENLVELAENIKGIRESLNKAKYDEDYETIDKLTLSLANAERDYNTMYSERVENRKNNPRMVTIDNLLTVVSEKTGIPVNQLNKDDKQKLIKINERLKSEIVGQDEAIDTICKALKRNRVGLHKHGCMYSMMSIGKSGTGKTLIAKKLAKEIFGSEDALVRFDMSEYPDKSAVNKLIGSNPGYIGYEDGGQLTEAIKKKKYCVLLLDEIEKADKEVYNIFLQVLDEGFLTDNTGIKVDFANVIVMFTSNIGAKEASEFSNSIGFENNVESNTKRVLTKKLKDKFPPEFLNRVDNIIYFNSLTEENLRDIAKLEMGKFTKRVNEIGYNVEYDESCIELLLELVKKDREFGARPILRAIQDNFEDVITDALLENNYESGHILSLYCNEGKVCLK